MFWKLTLVVLTLGGTACGLLVLRQQEQDVLATQSTLRRQISSLEKDLRAKSFRIGELSNLRRLEEYRVRTEAAGDLLWMPFPFAPEFDRPLKNSAVPSEVVANKRDVPNPSNLGS
ncbi:MAG: hypothetical protein O3A19_07330 [Planctomycetota bacterium]|jgi:hypothetical protein|nr:hypothetical protein [Planctomycetota bacterium]MDA1026227.1 hypothetical protein [Planctomycetota bacterium]